MSHGDISRLTRPKRLPPNSLSYPAMTSVVSWEGSNLTTDTATTALPHGDSAIHHIGTDDGDDPPTDPSYTGSTTKANAPSAEVLLGKMDPILAIVSNYNPRLEEWVQTKPLG